jgi:arylsulfatase
MSTNHCLRFLGALLLGLPMAAAEIRADAGGGPRPNFLLIMADDLGFSDLGCYGGEIPTPNLDRLAQGGRRFRNAYNYAVCGPTRLALMTGRHPHEVAVNVGFQVFDTLRPEAPTVAERLRSVGYRTFLAGKWHLGSSPDKVPTARGFERFAGILGGSANYFDPAAFRGDGASGPGADFYMTEAITASAVRYLAEAGRTEAPFFLYLAHNAPHFPLQARPADIARHRGRYRQGWDRLREARYARQIRLGLFEGTWRLAPRDELAGDRPWSERSEAERDGWDLHMAVYAAQVEVMDRGVGEVMAALDRIGRRDNTIVLFLSDNGACCSRLTARGGDDGTPPGPRESFATYGLHWANASNTPFRLYKTFLHEGGISTPLIARWPAAMAAGGGFNDTIVQVEDIPVTLLEAAGWRPDAAARLAGRSFLPVLRNKILSEDRDVCWQLWGNRALRRGDWKLVSRSNRLVAESFGRWRYRPAPHEEGWELYNLAKDRTESTNLARSRPELVAELARAFQEWVVRTGAPE